MGTESDNFSRFEGWSLDPFGELQKLWKSITEGVNLGVPHVVGRATISEGRISGLEMEVILHSEEKEYSFRDGNDVYFMVPARPAEGVEGIYVGIHRLLSDAK
ncbi:hypothetical protein [Thermococcus sp.]|uniref:hypothetical protein n=1 Tax=Thermococcus sp. TaxID=35749 RepID=UPI0025FF10A7|nr:hypothetical protein [Thermococcus sp.]